MAVRGPLKQLHEDFDDEEMEEVSNATSFYVNPDFQDRADGIEDGWYKYRGEEFWFRAGSYSGYGTFREALCEATHGIDCDALWQEGCEDMEFHDLINFADNEGCIGPKTSTKLAKEFKKNRKKVYEAFDKQEHAEYYKETYENFYKAFVLAGQGGFVKFT